MKDSMLKILSVVLISCVWDSPLVAQITAARLEQFILDNKHTGTAEVKEFYTHLNYQTAWIQNENAGNRTVLFNALERSAGLGLREKDYGFKYIEPFRNRTIQLQTTDDSIEAELRITDAAIHFYSDIVYGNTKPALGYIGIAYKPGCFNIPDLLAASVSNKTLALLIERISPVLPEIVALENKNRWLNTVMAEPGFREINIVSTKLTATNPALVEKLYQLGITDTVVRNKPDSIIKQYVKKAQRLFGLLDDGLLRSTVLRELNVPLRVRLQQLDLSVNYYRWLNCLIQDQSAIIVNIPAAYMKVYNKGKVILEMRVIVGKPSTPTPTLASVVDEVILYPYWHVPYSIATKELLPLIKRNPGFIDAGNYQVLNKSGEIVDPYTVNWRAFSTRYFPYIIRQSTGCDNALGLLKLNFYNPFAVYLHDTPVQSLFMLNKRYFSHGCMRMEKPMELGHLVLKNNLIAIDTLEQKGCLLNQSPVIVKADEQMPVIVWYNPAGIDAAGQVLFYEDVYEKFGWMNNK